MAATILTGPGRVAQIIWGTRLQNVLTFGYPASLDEPRFWRAPRLNSEQRVFGQLAESWTTARDWHAAFKARWFRLDMWAGGAGLQAFLDWAADGNAFTLVPDAAYAPLFAVPGCLLEEPFDRVTPGLEADGSQSIVLQLRNPTYDIGLAWRGLMFEYAPGADLAAPSGGAATFAQAQASGFFDSMGLFRSRAAAAIRDRHYPLGWAGQWYNGAPVAPRVTALEMTVAQKCTFPEDLTNAAWVKQGATAVAGSPANTPASPRGDATAVLIKEDGTTGSHIAHFNYTAAAAANAAGFQIFVRAAGRTKARAHVNNGAGPEVSVTFDLGAGTITASSAGIKIADIRPLAAAPNAGSGWFVITAYGVPGGASTGFNFDLFLHDASNNESYAGDSASGMYCWGVVLTDNQIPRTYWGTGTVPANDQLTWPIPGAFAAQPLFAYLKFTDLGRGADGAGFSNIFGWNSSGGAGGWRVLFYGPGSAANYSLSVGTLAGGPNVQSDIAAAGTTSAYGDTVELLGLLFPDTHPEIYMSKNGGAVTSAVGGVTPQRTISGSWAGQILDLTATGGSGGGLGWQQIKVGPLNYLNRTINTMPLARAT